MVASLKILVTNTFFSVALATSWMQIQTLDNNSRQKLAAFGNPTILYYNIASRAAQSNSVYL